MKTVGNPIVLGLSDVCADLFTFAAQLKKTPDPGDAEAFRLKVDELFRAFETRAKQIDSNDANVELAKYAMVALIDEIILLSAWPLKDSWSGRPLQLEYFNDFSAGEEFYNKLETLRNTDDARKLEVLEVYYTALALGFKGRYSDLQGMEKLKTIMEGVSKEIRKGKGKVEGLSPAWQPVGDPPRIVAEFPAWILGVAGLGWLLVLYTALAWILGGTTGDVLKAIK